MKQYQSIELFFAIALAVISCLITSCSKQNVEGLQHNFATGIIQLKSDPSVRCFRLVCRVL